jgi:hypothetical protein
VIGYHHCIRLVGGPLDGMSYHVDNAELCCEIRYAWTENRDDATVLREAFYQVTAAERGEADEPRTLVADFVKCFDVTLPLVDPPATAR